MAENDPVQCGSITSEVLQTYYDSIGRPWTLIRKPANPNNLPQLLNAGASLLLEQGDRNYGTLQFGGVISSGSVSAGAGGGSIWSGKRPTASNTASNYYPLGFEMGLSSTGGATNGIAITGYGGSLLMSIGPNGTIRDYSGVDILTATSLGVNVINSSLRTVGNLNSLNVTGNLAIKPAANLLVANATTEYVGIGTGTPSEKLDVTGNCNLATTHTYKIGGVDVLSETTLGANVVNSSLTSVGTLVDLDVSGNLTANTISATNWVGIPTPSLTPLTLDSTNNRVGINNATPMRALDVSGNASIDGQFQVASSGPIASIGLTVDPLTQITETVHLLADDIGCTGTISGTLTTAAQGNITSVGTLSGLTVGGTISQTSGTSSLGALSVPSVNCTGTISGKLTTAAQGNITSVGTLSGLTVGGTISQTAGTSSLGALTVPSISCSGNMSGTLSTAAQPNITSVGTLSTLNVTGDVNIDSGTMKVDSTNNRVGINQSNPQYPLDVLGDASIKGFFSLRNDSNNTNNLFYMHTSQNKLYMTTLSGSGSTDPVRMEFRTSSTGSGNATTALALEADQQLSTYGNIVQTNTKTASFGALTVPSITCSGNVSGTLTTASQPNITSVGTLSTLNVTGDVVVDTDTLKVDSTNNRVGIRTTNPTYDLDVNGECRISQNLFVAYNTGTTNLNVGYQLFSYGNIVQLGGTADLKALTVPSITCSGNISGTLITAAQPNITSVGTLTSITTSGNISQTAGTSSLGALTVPSISCSGNMSGTLTTSSQPNITSVGTLSTLNVTGDVAIDSNTIKVDSTNNRVGICTTNPAYNLEVTGTCNITGNLTVGGTIVNAGLGATTIIKNSSVSYSPATPTTAAVFQSVATITIPANSVCIVDCIVTITKNSSSTTGANATFRLQSGTTPNTLYDKQNCYLFNVGAGLASGIMSASSALNDTQNGHLIANEVQYNTTSSDVTLYLGWYLTGAVTAASMYRIAVNELVATVTKVGTI